MSTEPYNCFQWIRKKKAKFQSNWHVQMAAYSILRSYLSLWLTITENYFTNSWLNVLSFSFEDLFLALKQNNNNNLYLHDYNYLQYCKRYVKTRTKRKRNNNYRYYDINNRLRTRWTQSEPWQDAAENALTGQQR